tara:strand:+ start:361 stop:1188 length:828 start_codon:yes stop_codon:yes gene_type:complete
MEPPKIVNHQYKERKMDFGGKVALVTAAEDGVGREVALRLARAGADVAVHSDSDPSGASQVAAEIKGMGRRALPVQADIRDKAAVDSMVALVRRELGVIAVLIMCGSKYVARDFLETTVEEWDLMWDTHLKGSFLLTQEVCWEMKESGGGSIVLLTSTASQKVTNPDLAVFASAKAGQTMLAKSLAFGLAEYNIRANAVLAGPLPGDPLPAGGEGESTLVQTIPQKRLGTPAEVAAACLFLASDEAPFITGADLVIDGGHTLATTGATRPRVQKD